MHNRSCLTVVLAAGEGTRMKSTRPKVLHEIAGLPILAHVLRTAAQAGSDRIAVIAGPQSDAVRALVEREAPEAEIFVQADRLGTAHAVLQARRALEKGHDDVLVIFGDTPLVRPQTLIGARERIAAGNAVAVVGFEARDPSGYGRLVVRDGRLEAIREDRDCSEEERRISFCNSGLMAFAGDTAVSLLDRIGNDNAKSEFYLTDAVAIAGAMGLGVAAVEGDEDELRGINNQVELAAAESLWQERRRRELMLAGVSMQAPQTVFLSHDTVFGRDCRIEPDVWFGPGVRVGDNVRIRAFSHIEGATIGDGAEVGPYARLRPGAVLARGSKVGNFVEVKKSEIGEGAKVNHLTYVGDATIGRGANVGAGTITCNYDGFSKARTEIGAGAFIGSNSALVAPVRIGEGAIVAAGSVVTRDVPNDALAFGRARQNVIPGRAAEFRARKGR